MILAVSALSRHPSAIASIVNVCEGVGAGDHEMRVSHFAEIAAAIATFVATYLLFDGQHHVPILPANIQAALVGKSDRLALKEQEEDAEEEEQVFSPKLVRLEEYSRPADGAVNS